MMEDPEIVEGVEWTVSWPAPDGTIEDHTPTLRDQFAMAALTGHLAAPDSEGSAAHFANSAYQLADAMLAAREAK